MHGMDWAHSNGADPFYLCVWEGSSGWEVMCGGWGCRDVLVYGVSCILEGEGGIDSIGD